MIPEFDRFSSDYRRMLRHPIRDWFAPSGDFARRKLHLIRAFFGRKGIPTSGLRWLDVGCGQGDLLRLGRNEFASVAGCDPSPEMLAACGALPVTVQPNSDELPYPSQAFDLVTLVCVLHHVEPQQWLRLVDEIARVLRPDGWLCVIEHNPWNPATQFIVRRCPVDRAARLLSPDVTTRLLRDHGFHSLDLHYFLLVPERFYERLSAWEERCRHLPLGGQYAVFAQQHVFDERSTVARVSTGTTPSAIATTTGSLKRDRR